VHDLPKRIVKYGKSEFDVMGHSIDASNEYCQLGSLRLHIMLIPYIPSTTVST